MIVKEFNITDLNLKYFIGINQISIKVAKLFAKLKIQNQDQFLDVIFEVIEQIQEKYKESIIQFFSNEYILDLNHIYNACYFTKKAFINNTNISNKENLELLLYLATNRQIKIGIGAFGIKDFDLKKEKLNYCIISQNNNISEINNLILQKLLASEIAQNIDQKSLEKYNKIKGFFEINDEQIKVVLNSYGIRTDINDLKNYNLNDLYLALNDLICEKMALLSLEKITIN